MQGDTMYLNAIKAVYHNGICPLLWRKYSCDVPSPSDLRLAYEAARRFRLFPIALVLSVVGVVYFHARPYAEGLKVVWGITWEHYGIFSIIFFPVIMFMVLNNGRPNDL